MLAPEAWLALLRVVVGAWFLKAVWTKLALGLAWGILPYPMVSPRFVGFHPKRVAEFAAGNPIGWYKDFLEQTVLPNAALFAILQVWGEVAVGVGITLGLATRFSALVGLYLALIGGRADAADAMYLGLARHFIPQSRFGEFTEALANASGDVDVVFDPVGGETLERSWRVLKPGARVVTVATTSGQSSDQRVRDAFVIVRADGSQLAQIAWMIDAGELRGVAALVVVVARAGVEERTGQHHRLVGVVAMGMHDSKYRCPIRPIGNADRMRKPYRIFLVFGEGLQEPNIRQGCDEQKAVE